MLKTITLPSLYQIFPEACPEKAAKRQFSCLLNEPFSFQTAYKNEGAKGALTINVRIDSPLPISFYAAEYVPLLHSNMADLDIPARQGLYSDPLIPKKLNPPLAEEGFKWQTIWFEKGEKKLVNALGEAWQTLWFTVNEEGKTLKAGKYTLTFKYLNAKTGEELSREEIQLELIDKKLPAQKLMYTNWFHFDCVADATKTEMMSDEFFAAVYNYAKKAALNGQNMILTPCFTPPLDTPVGQERQTAQLVGVTLLGRDKYAFDFTLLKRYIDLCKKAGIKYFEINHLFTQWGAKAAPKVMAQVGGKEKRIFGWDTPSDSPKYRKFLTAFLTELTAFFRAEGLEKRVLFHISDEPQPDSLEAYGSAVQSVKELLKGFMVGDALSVYEIYEQGFTDIPIVATDHMESFKGKCDKYWCYYTGEQIKGKMSKRILAVSRERNRMIGVQMYSYKVKGFLHWGYNYYYDVLSHGYTDPSLNAGVYLMSAGTSYLVYPAPEGDCYQSIRQKIFGEGVLDMRALSALEELCGRDAVSALIEKHFGKVTFETGPDSPEEYLAFREELNSLIKAAL